MEGVSTHLIVGGAGLIVGFAFGVIAWCGKFCVASSFLSYVAAADSRGLRAIALASLTALVLSQVLDGAGAIDLDTSIYRTEALHWFGAIGGGFAFGYGMILASGCGAGSLVRLGGGDLRSLVVLIILAIFGYMTLRGLTGIPRVALEQAFAVDVQQLGARSVGLDDILSASLGGAADAWRWVVVCLVVLGLAIYCFSGSAFRASAAHIWSGVAAGICVAAGWVVTGVLGRDAFDPTQLASLTFVSPVANTLQYLMTYTGATVNFGIGTVVGVFLGSLCSALLRGEFRFQFIDGDRDLINALVGGALMGVGGVFAFGCSIGNGLTGISTLGAGAFVGSAAIVAGGLFAARRLLRMND